MSETRSIPVSKQAARFHAFASTRWGDDVLDVTRLADGDAVALPLLDAPRLMARVTRSALVLEVPAGLVADVRLAGATSSVPAPGPCRVELAPGDSAELRGATPLSILFEVTGALEPFAQGHSASERRRGRAGVHFALAALLHVAVLGVARYSAEAAEALDEHPSDVESMKNWLAKADRRAAVADPIVTDPGDGDNVSRAANGREGDGHAGGGARAADKAGGMGLTSSASKQRGRYALPRRADVKPRLAREEALVDARSFGAIGLLAQGPASPTASFGEAEASGRETMAADGAMWGRRVTESAGAGGLGLSGIGIGGGGSGEGIGLGSLGALGHSFGTPGDGTGGRGSLAGSGEGFSSWWSSTGRPGSHRVKAPVYRYSCCGTQVSGRLPPEAIQRITRGNFGRFRACYEAGLLRNPRLEGRVSTRFLIARDGSVASAADAGSSMPDPRVTACVVRAFYGLGFPQPEGGTVTVVYPITFSPG